MKKQNDDKNKRCNLYLKQENKINNYYMNKKNRFKNCIDESINKFKINYNYFKTFCTVSTMYIENINKNIYNIKKLLSHFNTNEKESDLSEQLNELERLILYQLDGEKEKIERLNFNKELKKGIPEYEKRGKEIENELYNHYHEYINLMDKLYHSHVNYLRNFNDYEIKMINIETKDKNELKESDINLIPKKDKILVSLHYAESQYKSTLESVNNSMKVLYKEVKTLLEEYNKYNKELKQIIGSNVGSIYLGYITSTKMQQTYDEKVLKLKNLKANNKLNDSQYNEYEENIKVEKLCEDSVFKKYDLLSPFANIEGYKQSNKLLKELKPEIIYKISCIINSEFDYIPKVDLKEQYRIMDVKLICEKILEENSIDKNLERQLYQYLEERKYRLAFLAALNKIRTLGKFQISKKSLIALGNIIKIIVDKLYKEKNYDYEIISYLIIMCQTYFSLGIDGKEKVYLIRFIEDSKYFRSENLWNCYINQIIDNELETMETKNMWNLEKSQEDENNKMSKIYFGKLFSLTQNIMEFKIDKKIVHRIIHNLIDTKYNIPDDLINPIDQFIENTIYIEKIFIPERDIL